MGISMDIDDIDPTCINRDITKGRRAPDLSLTMLGTAPGKVLVMCGGYHRYVAVCRIMSTFDKRSEALEKKRRRWFNGQANVTPTLFDIDKELSCIKEQRAFFSTWGVIVYDAGMSLASVKKLYVLNPLQRKYQPIISSAISLEMMSARLFPWTKMGVRCWFVVFAVLFIFLIDCFIQCRNSVVPCVTSPPFDVVILPLSSLSNTLLFDVSDPLNIMILLTPCSNWSMIEQAMTQTFVLFLNAICYQLHEVPLLIAPLRTWIRTHAPHEVPRIYIHISAAP